MTRPETQISTESLTEIGFSAMDAYEDFFRTMIDQIPTLAWSCRPDGTTEFLNHRWLAYTGLSNQESLGWGWKGAIHSEDLAKLMETWRRVLASGEPGEEEARLRRFDGKYRWFLFRAVPVRDDAGKVIRWYGTNTDIEDLKRAQSLLAAEKTTLEMIAAGASLTDILDNLCRAIDAQSSNSSSTVLLMDLDGERLWPIAGPRVPGGWVQTITPLKIGPSVGSCGTAAFLKKPVITEDVAIDPLWADYREAALGHGVRASWSLPLISKDDAVLGTFAMYYSEPRSPSDSDLELIKRAGQIALIAIERKRTENALQESEERFRQMADTLPEVIWITSLEPEKVLYVSPSFERIWRRPVEELYRNPRLWIETIHPEDRDRVASTFTRWIAGEQVSYHDVEFRIIQPNGATRWIHERGVKSLNAQGKPHRVSGISTDITDRKRAEEELRRSEVYLAEAQRLSLTGSFGWTVSSGDLFWSKETFCIVGYDQGTKPTLELVLQRVHPEDRAFVQQTFDSASRDGIDVDFEHRFLFPDGSVKHVHVIAHPIRGESGILEFVGAVSDITARKLAEEKIWQNERELRRIVDLIPQIIIVIGSDGKPLYANRGALDYTGLSLEEILSVGFGGQLSQLEDVEKLRTIRRESLGRGLRFELEQRMLGKDGHFRWFIFRYNPLRDEYGNVIRWYVTATDIEDRKQAEERVQKENLALREEIDHSSMFEEIVGSSSALRRVLKQVTKVATTDSTVLILGETGTGKELIARAIHKRSNRSARAFIRVNCAAIPQSLIASELFGHEKGAFTGALQRRLGRFELADGGTIFLDEIGDLPGETQLALLRVLQEREFERVGGSQTISVDVRVLAATNRDLNAAVAAGTFRQDLYYRLSVFPIQTPSLRERVDDIPLLVEYFIERYAKKAGKKFRQVRTQTLELFQAYDWPGNIRELQNVIERAVILCETETFSVDETWLKRDGPRSQPAVPFVATIVEREKEIIEAALAACRGRIAGALGAATKLGIPRQTLDSKIKSLGIDKHRFKARQAN
jgi:PAS domain S-box-containing protein